MKSFKMGTGHSCSRICEAVIKYMVEEKNAELYKQNKNHPGTDFSGEVIMAGEMVRVNLYKANDRDAVNFGIYYERMWSGKL